MHFRVRFLFFLMFIIAAASLQARGTRDSVLAEADELIEMKRYNEAVQLLHGYMNNNPDRFGEAQKRMQQIVKIRERFNAVAEELLDTVMDHPDDYEKILNLSNQLTALGSASDTSTQIFLNQVRELAAFNVNRRQLEDVLEEARSFLSRGDFQRALAVYAGGLSIYRDDFFNSGYGDEAEQTARQGLFILNESIAGFNSIVNPFSQAVSDLENMAGRNPLPQAVTGIYEILIPLMVNISNIRSNFVYTESEFDAMLQLLQENHPGLQDRSFLSFANRLIRGPLGLGEGMIGTLDRYWDQKIIPAESIAADFTDQSYAAAVAAYENGRIENISLLADITRQYLFVSQGFIDYWTLFLESAGVLPLSFFNADVTPFKTSEFFKYRAMDRSLDFLKTAADISARETHMAYSAYELWQHGNIDTATAISMEQGTRVSLNELRTEISELENLVSSEIVEYEVYRSSFYEDHDPRVYFNRMMEITKNLETTVISHGMQAFVRQYTISNDELVREVILREGEFGQGNSYISGVGRYIEGIEGESGTIEYSHYPAEGIEILALMNQRLAADMNAGRDILARLNNEPTDISGSNEGSSLYNTTNALIARLQYLVTQSAVLTASARVQVDRAAALRMEGDRLFQEAQAALARNNFDMARERLTMTQNRYRDSLAIQETENIRNIIDTQLVAFGAQIIRTENEFVVREVRERVTRARNSYYQGNFDAAEQELVLAQNRWRTTNSTDEPEVSYWLTMTRNALSLSSGRIIPITAPLYSEMSQLLSDAKLNYEEGVRLMNSGRRQDGLARFNEARRMTQKVELMFPLNREARLLDLRIEQFTDPGAFNSQFRSRLDAAIAGTKPNIRSVESFAELQNLAEINPSYPNIRNIIFQAEIDMGYRPPPPDSQALARSANLANQARPIVNNRNSAMYEVALTWLNEAIDLNPDNDDAIILKDALNILLYGTGIIVIDSESYDDYQRAVTEFQRGNRYTAWTIVQELLKNPQNQRSTQILELQRRIEASLW